MEKNAEQQAQPVTETADKKAAKGSQGPGRNKMTLAECKRLGLDPRPYGLLSKAKN